MYHVLCRRLRRVSYPVVACGLAASMVVVGVSPSTRAEQSKMQPAAPTAKLLQRLKPDRSAIRRPVALCAFGGNALVGNRRSGTISVIELQSDHAAVAGEYQVATTLSSLAATNDGLVAFVTDDQANLLIVLRHTSEGPIVALTHPVPHSSVRVVVSSLRDEVFVAGRWSRSLTRVRFSPDFTTVVETRTVQLPFAPHELVLLDDDRRLLVSDAFSNRLTIVDTTTLQERAWRRLAGSNIRGLAVSLDQRKLYASQQVMNPLIRADFDGVHWGSLVSNSVQVLDTDALETIRDMSGAPPVDTSSQTQRYQQLSPDDGWLDHFGGIGDATGDPGPVITGPDGLIAVALSGIGEVSIRRGNYSTRIDVGRRPGAMLVHGDALLVANEFDDSVTVVDVNSGSVHETVQLGRMSLLTASDRGEMLFYDAGLSHDGWMSCHSCHTDGHSSGLLVDTLGDGDYGAPKRVPSLLGTAQTAPWAWNGGSIELTDQVRKSITTTMHGDELSDSQVGDLTAFLVSLTPPPPVRQRDVPLARRGRSVFERQGCAGCHRPPYYTSEQTYDVGISDQRGRTEFNPPSLLGVGQRDRLFHDGRVTSINDAILGMGHFLKSPLTRDETESLLEFLNGL